VREDVRVRGRYVAGEELAPGRLVVLVEGVIRYWTPGATRVLGIVLARQYVNAYALGDLVPVARRGVVLVDGKLPSELEPARVTDAGLFVATGGELVPRAFSYRGCAVELTLS
jgi:hypothetical protein